MLYYKHHRYLDYALLLTYDYHGSWENQTGLHSAFVGRRISDTKNVVGYMHTFLQIFPLPEDIKTP